MGPIQAPSRVCREESELEKSAKKRPLLTESDEEALKRLRSAYDALETQAWIGGSLQQVNEITLTFNHQETCVVFEM
jgi:hypothetical protein